jgi:Ca2+-binding RTX toxin-like protein
MAGNTITVVGGNGDITVTAGLAAGLGLVLDGGSGADLFNLSATTVGTSKIAGGAGDDTLVVTSSGTINLAGLTGVETIDLAGAGKNALTFSKANFAKVSDDTIDVVGGNGGNTIDGIGIFAPDRVVMTGGAGADTLIAAENAAMTGGAGRDVFEFTQGFATGNNTVADFAHGTDKIALSNSGFSVGPNPDAATSFTASPTGAFTTAAQRFAYDTETGALFFDPDGNGSSAATQIATLTGHPILTASDVRFVS